MPRPAGLPKTGGRRKGSANRPKPVILSPDEAAQSRAMTIVTPAEVDSEGGYARCDDVL